MNIKLLTDAIYQRLDEHKAQEIVILDVRSLTSVTDTMFICTGTSGRHVKALAEYVTQCAKENGCRPIGVEGDSDSEWILIDLGDIVVHVMQAATREFYRLEKLWALSDPNHVTSNNAESSTGK